MWPLLCNEIGLSYDQEEKVRVFQRSLLQEPNSWLARHTAYAQGQTLSSAHTAMQAVLLRTGQRETGSSLSLEQRKKLTAWTARNKEKLRAQMTAVPVVPISDSKHDTSPEQHVAGNLYVLNHRLRSILNKIPPAAPIATGVSLKKLSQRPSFESLGCLDENMKLSRDNSFASSGSLKRSASEMSMDSAERIQSSTGISPEQAQAAAESVVQQTLGHLKDIIPPPPVVSVPLPTPVAVMAQKPLPEPQHVRKSSFLPAHLNVVPEEMWPADSLVADDDILMSLVDDDWNMEGGIAF